ncbi:RNA polymerase Rpb4-domain-containing protein [Tricharina praecox]|uniref:RNA polymerase Rpb4-domain-containing protein n=1 Tax=Tricharina praecox TaxID=43433 RepID=UPI0022210F5C|nr:RNA polymerase Rpb4-domain-containing protein [Tricharina praecox]KAI5849799.1 RNA polymerase Rpb4-domain-containing protein [Tricharina praecox]
MKILNPRVGMLSNHEVLVHITAMKARYTEIHHRVGGAHAMKAENLETVMKEVRDYLLVSPCASQTDGQISTFMEAVSAWPLEKGELLQIVNERPETIAELDCIVEEMDTRFDESVQVEILATVKRLLPPKPLGGVGSADGGDMAAGAGEAQ